MSRGIVTASFILTGSAVWMPNHNVDTDRHAHMHSQSSLFIWWSPILRWCVLDVTGVRGSAALRTLCGRGTGADAAVLGPQRSANRAGPQRHWEPVLPQPGHPSAAQELHPWRQVHHLAWRFYQVGRAERWSGRGWFFVGSVSYQQIPTKKLSVLCHNFYFYFLSFVVKICWHLYPVENMAASRKFEIGILYSLHERTACPQKHEAACDPHPHTWPAQLPLFGLERQSVCLHLPHPFW